MKIKSPTFMEWVRERGGIGPIGENAHGEQCALLLNKLSFTPQAFLDNQRDMHFGIGLPERLHRIGDA